MCSEDVNPQGLQRTHTELVGLPMSLKFKGIEVEAYDHHGMPIKVIMLGSEKSEEEALDKEFKTFD